MSSRSTYDAGIWLFAFILVFFLTLVFLLDFQNISSDYRDYYSRVGARLASGEGLDSFYFSHKGDFSTLATAQSGVFIDRFPPGMYFISALAYLLSMLVNTDQWSMMLLLQGSCVFIAGLLVRQVIGEIFPSKSGWYCWIPSILVCFSPLQLYLLLRVNSEIFLFPVFMLAFLYSNRFFRSYEITQGVKLGLAFGICMLMKAYMLIFVFSYYALIFFQDIKVFKRLVPGCCLLLIVVVPWVLLIFLETGVIIPLASSGFDNIGAFNAFLESDSSKPLYDYVISLSSWLGDFSSKFAVLVYRVWQTFGGTHSGLYELPIFIFNLCLWVASVLLLWCQQTFGRTRFNSSILFFQSFNVLVFFVMFTFPLARYLIGLSWLAMVFVSFTILRYFFVSHPAS